MIVTKTMKLHIKPDETDKPALAKTMEQFRLALNDVSAYVFDHHFPLKWTDLSKILYSDIRSQFKLKSQMTQSVFRTVCARYKSVQTQLKHHPFSYKDEDGKWHFIKKTLEWLYKPIYFSRPQVDLVRGRDYSFVENGTMLSLNTLDGRIKVAFDVPECFSAYFDGTWSFGTGKVVTLKDNWYFHIPMTREMPDSFDAHRPNHVVGLDRGLRFLATAYDEKGKTSFFDGKAVLKKRAAFDQTRAELQAKGTKSAKRKLKAISGRENRYMTDVNHQLSKTLVDRYGKDTLFVIEDLTGVSFADENLSKRSKQGRHETRSWTFYQLEQFLTYKAQEAGSDVLIVPADYTSQRCPKCGRIRQENRDHIRHAYICDACGYRSNDDRVGAMNLYELGTMYVSGDNHPRFGTRCDKDS